MSKLKWALVAAFLMTACAHTKKTTPSAGGAPEASEEKQVQIRETEDSSEKVETNVEKPYQSPMGEIALDQNKHVDQWLKYFQGKGRKFMNVYLSRSTRYLP